MSPSLVYASKIIDVRGAKVEVRSAGAGPDLLYLHGGGGDSEWQPLYDTLASRFTFHLPLHPGFGQSTGIERIDGMEDLVFHYLDVIAALGLDQQALAVVGSSFGGWLAAELATRYPEVMQQLVLIDAAGLWLNEAPIEEMFGSDPPALAKLLFHDQEHPMARMLASLVDFTRLPEEILLSQFRAMEALAKVAWNPYFHNPKLEGRLYRVSAKTLVVWGRQDKLIPVAHGERYAASIPGAQLRIVDECGHQPVFERPAEVERLLFSFLC